MANDPISVRIQSSSLHNRFNDPKVRQKLTVKFQEMEREIGHIQTAMRTIQNAIRTNVQFPNSGVARANQQLRDWVLSLIESEAYVDGLLAGENLAFRMELLATRAAKLGTSRGVADR